MVLQGGMVDFFFFLTYNVWIYSFIFMSSSKSLDVIVPQKKSRTKRFSVGMILPLTEKNNAEFFLRSLEALCELGFEIKVLGEGDAVSQKKCFDIMKCYPRQFEVLESHLQNREKLLASVDLLLFPEMPDKGVLKMVRDRQIVSVFPSNSFFQDFNAQEESGNAFLFHKNNFWEFFTAIIRASENYKFSYDWKNIRENIKEVVL